MSKDLINNILDGVGKDAEIVTNSLGGKQSKAPMAMHLIDPDFLDFWFNPLPEAEFPAIRYISDFMKTGNKMDLIHAIYECQIELSGEAIYEDRALEVIAKVLQEGAEKYSPNNWRLIPQEDHINHALIHYLANTLGDNQDDHLQHCMCRLMMAYATSPSKDFNYTTFIA